MSKYRVAFQSEAIYREVDAPDPSHAAERFVEDWWFGQPGRDDNFEVDVVDEAGTVRSFTVDVEFQVEAFAFPANGQRHCKVPKFKPAAQCQADGGLGVEDGPQTD
jgi:hypothetical protein